MIKNKTFYFLAEQYEGEQLPMTKFTADINEYDEQIQKFLDILSEDGYALISMTAVSFGRYGNNNRIRTSITYRETPTRKVLVEKV